MSGEVNVGSANVKALVMLVISVAWFVYVGSMIFRNMQPDQWTWGIPIGAYVALYQPWAGSRQNPGLGGRGPGNGMLDTKPAEDSET